MAEMRRVKVRGCRGCGKRGDPPFDHYTGRGRVAVHRGASFDAIYNKKSKVVLVLVEAFGGIVDETMEKAQAAAAQVYGPGRGRSYSVRASSLVAAHFYCASHAAPLCGCNIV
jgi:hypothetical protein